MPPAATSCPPPTACWPRRLACGSPSRHARRRCPPAQLSPELPFNELGIDSLDGVSLAAELEETLGRPVDPGLLFDHPTPHALARHLADCPDSPIRQALFVAPAEPDKFGLG